MAGPFAARKQSSLKVDLILWPFGIVIPAYLFIPSLSSVLYLSRSVPPTCLTPWLVRPSFLPSSPHPTLLLT